ncbi:addiction module antitoxin, RelB/DinJ family [Xenococcus sp. PCC 7305]|uniref:type II toxin-antitoxin system RelB/DinJ family antitoxin n=1 Tax=Xenococcus sp. PCC 7305 TaxID=102125 RepID=UPI0002AC8B53|nr:type II toxin-antitoxin system RelB/DinJ family antitoxin [Xenococcus sp. PCC 7305]ELS04631.1 addiction module antitoxin, RelB/DinJ family [Xenococcus sp. PCC 7305]
MIWLIGIKWDKAMTKTDRIEARIESDLKQAAEAVFSKLGMTPSDAIRIFYKQVELHQGFPFDVKMPNAETLAVIEEIENHPERLKCYESVDEMFKDWDIDK